MAVNGKRFDFSKFKTWDTDPELERNGVPTPVFDSGIVLLVRRAGGRNFGFEKHSEAVRERWQKTHGRGTLAGDDLRQFNRDVFSQCIAGWNEDVVGVPYSTEAAHQLMQDIEGVYQATIETAAEWQRFRQAKTEDAKDATGNG